MKKKIIGILVLTLVISAIATPISAINYEHKQNNEPITKDADVPIWEVGDSWTYNMQFLRIGSPNVTDGIIFEGGGELVFEVVEDSGDTYVLNGFMKPIVGTVAYPGPFDFKLTRRSSYESTFEVRKSNLAIISYDSITKGIALIKIGPITLPIPIQLQEERTTEFEPVCELLPFPLYDGKTGNYDRFAMIAEWDYSAFWGLVSMDSGSNDEGWVGDGPYTCKEETITVAAGTFDVFNVSGYCDFEEAGHDFYHSCYAEEVGSIVKGIYNLDWNNGETSYFIEFELVETTY
jgi:hypothetical protein